MKKKTALATLKFICRNLEKIHNESDLIFDSVNLLHIKAKLELVIMCNNQDYIIMFNNYTGEVRKTNASFLGYKNIKELLIKEIKYTKEPLKNIKFRGNKKFVALLEKDLKKVLNNMK